MGGFFHCPLRYSHEALRFLAILGKSFFPILHICALHTRQRPALTKRLEQLGIFVQPRSDEFSPFLAESLQGRAKLRVQLADSVSVFRLISMNPAKSKAGTESGICRNRCHSSVGLPFFPPLFCMRKERFTPMAKSVVNVMPTNGLVRDGPLPRSSAPKRLLQFSCARFGDSFTVVLDDLLSIV